ncbi:hypothetical protein [Luteirhabdus pelagi]|uniref:hypothetical protein n=1 Tax=Luteirhabdus pelagi TaxID=2792783 RepID=UPI001939C1A2|nr:hypothetical protein [Luteirhabdus pelagi]
MNKNKDKRQKFDINNIPIVGSLGILALGDIGFTAWRKAKVLHNQKKENEKE